MINEKDLKQLFKNITYYRKEEFIDIMIDLADYLTKADEERKRAVDQLAEFNSDSRIKELEQKLEIERKRTNDTCLFSIDPEDVKRINDWKSQHEAEKHTGNGYAGAIGGRYTYEFTPTSIGTFGKIRCSCGEYFNYND